MLLSMSLDDYIVILALLTVTSLILSFISAKLPEKLDKGQPRICEATPLVFNR